MTDSNWAGYYVDVGEKPNALVENTLREFNIRRGHALDLGCGNFRDSKFLLSEGFEQVIAVDSSPEVPEAPLGVVFKREQIEDYLPGQERFDLIICINSLFFVDKRSVERFFTSMRAALRPGGVIVCNFLGESDDWVRDGREGISWFARREAEELGRIYRADRLEENLFHKKTVLGHMKLWHIWDMVYGK